ncbi:MAG: cell division protein FtsZ [Dehalococcoidia bacterium]
MSLNEFARRDNPHNYRKDRAMSIRDDGDGIPKITVVGVGGAGCNAVNRMVEAQIPGVTFIACNTDGQALNTSLAPYKLRIGEKVTRGLGAGANPDKGERSAEESRDEIYEMLRGSDMVFVTAGMGGGTGTGAAPIVAEVARECGALTVGVITKPFRWEGQRKAQTAEEGIRKLADKVDTLISVPNARLREICPPNLTTKEAFKFADDVLRQAIQAIANIIQAAGEVNVDFNDVRTTMSEAGPALLAIGRGSGETRASDAARAATQSPLLDQSIDGAQNVLFCLTHNGSMRLSEMDDAGHVIAELADPNVNLIWGEVVDPEIGEDVQITLIATGFQPKAQSLDDPRQVRRIQDLGLQGVQSMEDAELPAFLRRRIPSLNVVGGGPAGVAVAKLAERR